MYLFKSMSMQIFYANFLYKFSMQIYTNHQMSLFTSTWMQLLEKNIYIRMCVCVCVPVCVCVCVSACVRVHIDTPIYT